MGDELDISTDMEGQFSELTVQSKGRLNIPDAYLNYLGVNESESVFIMVKDGEVVLKKASVDMIAAVAVVEAMSRYMDVMKDG